MTETARDPFPEDAPMQADDDSLEAAKAARDALDPRSDIEQVVEARSDAVVRGEGGTEPATFTDTGMPDGPGGTGGLTKNQDHDQQ